MIPTMLLYGLILGRWWKTCLVVGSLCWPLFLWLENIIDTHNEFLGATGLAALNTAVGVALHQSLLRLLKWLRKDRRALDHAPTPARRHSSERRGNGANDLLAKLSTPGEGPVLPT
jgi:hypothetical protein